MSQHRRGPWSQNEDLLLRQLVNEQGASNWVLVSQRLGSRTPKQCRERYHQNLKPSLNHDPITAEEGEKIEQMVAQRGKRWAEIARHLDGRSDNAVKNWWNGNQNRRRRSDRRRTLPSHHHQYDDGGYHQASPGLYHPQHSLSIHPHIDPYGRGLLPSPTSPAYLQHGYSGYHSESSVPSPSSMAGASPRSDVLDTDAAAHSDSASSYTTSYQSLQLAPIKYETKPRSLPGVEALLGAERRESSSESNGGPPPPAYLAPSLVSTAPNSPRHQLVEALQRQPSLPNNRDSMPAEKDMRMDIGKMIR